MDKWHPYDIKQLIRESKFWEKREKEIRIKIADLRGLSSVNNESGVRTKEPSKITENTAIKILTLEKELEEIKTDREKLSYGLSVLDNNERSLVEDMYFSHKSKGIVVWEYGRKNGINKDYVYRDLNKILTKMSAEIDRRYYGAE